MLAMAVQALYLHLPFCRSRCAYCDFCTRAYAPDALEAAAGAYVDALIPRLKAFAAAGALDAVKTVYIGGGTPTATGEQLPRLVRAVRHLCRPQELTCEANPESLGRPMAAALARAGATRVSIGVQSLDDAELAAVGRIHTADQALEALESAKRAGLSCSVDLMCGLPGQTLASWEGTLGRAVAAGPDHVSVYPLALEEGTPLACAVEAGEVDLPDDDFQADAMAIARITLASAGYVPYEVASCAKPGKACRHNIAYWTGVEYLGLGRSAASMFSADTFEQLAGFFCDEGGARLQVPEGTARVRVAQLDDGATSFEFDLLSAREAAAEDLMLACRMTRGIPVGQLEAAARSIPRKQLMGACERAVKLGLAEWTDESNDPLGGDKPQNAARAKRRTPPVGAAYLAPTQRGWLLGNELFGLFWDLA